MIESTVVEPVTEVALSMSYIQGSTGGVINIDGHRVGQFSFVDSRALEQFMALIHLLAKSPSC